jgi:hypothetical protein
MWNEHNARISWGYANWVKLNNSWFFNTEYELNFQTFCKNFSNKNTN